MKKTTIGKRLLCLCLVLGILTGVNVFGRRNNYEWANPAQPVYINDDFKTWGANDGFRECILRAMESWNVVKNPKTGAPICQFIAKSSSPNRIRLTRLFNEQVAGVTEFDPYYDPSKVPAHTKIRSFAIKLNSEIDWYDGEKAYYTDIQSIVQHELGHALGIAHCHEKGERNCNSICYRNTMFWMAEPYSVEKRYLKDYDKSSKLVIYT